MNDAGYKAMKDIFLARMASAEHDADETGDDGSFVEYNTWSNALAILEAAHAGDTKSLEKAMAVTEPFESPASSFGGVEVVRCEDCDRINDDYAKTCAGCGARITS